MTDPDQISVLSASVREFAAERNWSQFHDPKNLAMAIASEAGELLAELRWVKNDESDALVADSKQRIQIEHEIGDIAIALLLFCDRAKIDLSTAITCKLDFNRQNYPRELAYGRAERPKPKTSESG